MRALTGRVARLAWTATLALVGIASAEIICVTSVSGVAFGTYEPRQLTPAQVEGSVTVQCRTTALLTLRTVPFTIALSPGGSGSFNRAMSSGAQRLAYTLLTPTGQIWGDGTQGTFRVSGVADVPLLPGSGLPVTLPIRGMVPAGQQVLAGTYSDTVTVTVEY